MDPRIPTHRYEDPLDRVWLGCAERVGLVVRRDPGAFATTDGRGVLRLATQEHLDPDDCVAQMVFHELCHALVEGPSSFDAVDWGLDNVGPADEVREHACLRVQAALTRPLGLARVLAPTTDFRAFWDGLGDDLFSPGDEPSVLLARRALARVDSAPWAPHLREALDATAQLARAAAAYGSGRSASGSVWSLVDPARAAHPTGLPRAALGTPAADQTCGGCSWAERRGRGLRCLVGRRAVRAAWPACERWETEVSCEACGACCREAFDTLLVGAREPVVRRHPALVVLGDGGHEMPRPHGRCAALRGQGGAEDPFACSVYEDRPRTCRDFRRGSENCLLARRRVGLSR